MRRPSCATTGRGRHSPTRPDESRSWATFSEQTRAGPLQSTMRRCAGLGPIFELNVFAQKFVFVAGAELAAELGDETRFHKALSPGLEALRGFAGIGIGNRVS